MYNNSSKFNGIFRRIELADLISTYAASQDFRKESGNVQLMYNIASNLTGIFRRISKATE